MTHQGAVYDFPLWYERAFSWRNISEEVRCLLELATNHTLRSLESVGELFAGPAVHAAAFQAAGLRYFGVDHNPAMIAHAQRTRPEARLICADALMPSGLPNCDLLVSLLGSLCCPDAATARAHFAATARMVKPGGLYILEWAVINGGPALLHDHWHISGTDFELSADYSAVPLESDEHYRERLLIVGRQDEQRVRLEQRNDLWAMPQHFLRKLCEEEGHWDFIGSWDNWDLRQDLADDAVGQRPLTALRRTAL